MSRLLRRRPQRAVHDLARLDGLSPTVDKVLLVSDRSLYVLQNYVAQDIDYPSIFSLSSEDGFYEALDEHDDEVDLYYDVIRHLKAEVYQAECPMEAIEQTWVQAYRNGNITVPDQTYYRVTYNTELEDALDEFDPSLGVFTPKETGLYQITARLMMDSSTAWSSWAEALILYLGSTVAGTVYKLIDRRPYNTGGASVNATVGGTITAKLAEGQGVAIQVWQNSGAAQVVWSNVDWNWIYQTLSITRHPYYLYQPEL